MSQAALYRSICEVEIL